MKQSYMAVIKSSLTHTLFMLISLSAFAQRPPLARKWDIQLGWNGVEQISWLDKTNDAGTIITGFSTSCIGGNKTDTCYGERDYWVVKLNSDGVKEWDRDYGGTDRDMSTIIRETNDGGFIIGGFSISGIGGNKTVAQWGNSENYWIIKTDSIGNVMWQNDFGGFTGQSLMTDVALTTDKGYVLCGYSSSNIGGTKTQNSFGNMDYWIIKVDSLGNKLWDKTFGGASADYGFSICNSNDGGFIIGGSSYSDSSGNKLTHLKGNWDYWIIKIDSTGNKIWEKDYGGPDRDDLKCLIKTNDNGYLLGGFSESGIGGDKTGASKGHRDYWIIKIDSAGNKMWDKDYGGSDFDNLVRVANCPGGGYLVSGKSTSPASGDKTEDNITWSTANDTWFLKIDSVGNILWDKTIPVNNNSDYGMVIQTDDSNYVAGCHSNGLIGGDKSQNTINGYEYWLIKYGIPSTLPTASFYVGDSSFCQNSCTNFFSTSENDTAWHWLFPGATPDTSNIRYPTNICYNNSAGVFDVTLIACNQLGCDTTTYTNLIHVNPFPTVNLGADTLLCFGDSITLNAGVGNASYLWSTGQTTSNITVMGGYFSVTVTNSNQCTQYDDITVGVQLCIPPIDSFTVYNKTMCPNSCTDFIDLSIPFPTSWMWYFPGAVPDTSSDEDPVNICYSNPGVYDVKLVVCNQFGCDSVTYQNYITVNPNPVSSIWISNDTLYVTSGIGFHYQWMTTTGQTLFGHDEPFYAPGYFNGFFCIVSDSNGCTFTTDTIYITAINQFILANQQHLFTPNPSTDFININDIINGLKTPYFQISDMNGRIIMNVEIRSNQKRIDINILPQGVYCFKLFNGAELIGTQKLLKL